VNHRPVVIAHLVEESFSIPGSDILHRYAKECALLLHKVLRIEIRELGKSVADQG